MSKIALIGSSDLYDLPSLQISGRDSIQTPFGEPSGALTFAKINDRDVILLARHGDKYTIPPHQINYRANIWALRQAGANHILATASVGGIRPDMTTGHFAVPDQLIDYTYGRTSTFCCEDDSAVPYLDFAYPYSRELRALIINTAKELGIYVSDGATYGVAQGPRSQTIAEINRMERDGCDLVGMSGMPEAVLARELSMEYACIAIVTNKAAGRRGGETVTREAMTRVLQNYKRQLFQLLSEVVSRCD